MYKGYLVSLNQLNGFVTVFDGSTIVAKFENAGGGNLEIAYRVIDEIVENNSAN